MDWGKHFLEAATLIIAAIICALVSNAVASRERKLVVVSNSGGLPAAVPVPRRGMPAPTTSSPAPAPAPTAAPTTENRQPTTAKKTPLQLPVKSVKAAQKQFDPHPDKPYIEIHGDDVAYLHSNGVLFLDARRTSVYEQGHIPGARPFSIWESDVDDKVNKLFAERPDAKDQNQPIVIYCSGGDCEDSHMLAQKLWGIGFNNAYVYKDGFPDWQKRGEPVHTGPNP
jgi:rhodanese-related sulfurtransferase